MPQVMSPVLWELSYKGSWHTSKLLKVFWVWVNLFKMEGQGKRKRAGLAEGINPRRRGQWGCARETVMLRKDPHESTSQIAPESRPEH